MTQSGESANKIWYVRRPCASNQKLILELLLVSMSTPDPWKILAHFCGILQDVIGTKDEDPILQSCDTSVHMVFVKWICLIGYPSIRLVFAIFRHTPSWKSKSGYTVVNIQKLWKITMINGKNHYFYGHFQ